MANQDLPARLKYNESEKLGSIYGAALQKTSENGSQVQKALEAAQISAKEVIALVAELEKRLAPISRQDSTLTAKSKVDSEAIRVIVSPLSSELWNLWKPMSDLALQLRSMIDSLDI